MAQRLNELDAEAARLAARGQRLTADNPVAVALLSDFDDVMRANGVITGSVSGAVQETGVNAAGPVVRQLALPGFDDAALASIGVQWNVPNPDAINALVNFVGDPLFAEKLGTYSTGTVAQVQGVIINGAIRGRGPIALARDVRSVVHGLPAHNANSLLRTLQLTSFREAQVVHRVSNAHILEYQIRIATLDDRTCMTCVALHGTQYPIEARIDDHDQGRCTSVTKVRGMQAPIVESGPDWFGRQTDERQRAQMGNAAWDAWQDGAFTLAQYPKPYQDDVFGNMIGTNSLVGMIGERAEAFK